ncbi:DExH-box ATP-dependent RNA helicase DExH7, chloroplastic-like [Iris pallida]|uniref:DExH-box ATP-dependent RNA helicase DExH7, chloroplastic-like n=1 Tax=Iris pallida TaxID=29817 RepID=A0AAX6IIY6_IRIPA|nr:DExH-box ATP-dependent RNA helicase DExH7, chloroplastic-like [Iris pallida]
MAPKKKQQHQQKPANPKSKSQPAIPKPAGAKLQISAENERRLRRLLLNTDRPAPDPQLEPALSSSSSSSRAQKSKRLRSVYDKLSLEGFTSLQIEKALFALREEATFESALDWLCLNCPGSELPLKFSSGVSSSEPEERAVKIISTAREDYVPPQRPQDEVEERMPGLSVRIKGRRDELSLDLGKSSQADWIRQYMEQEEAEQEEAEQVQEEEDPSCRAASIAEEYHNARLGAQEAKQRKDKKKQEHFSEIILKLKQEMSSLGLSADLLVSSMQDQSSTSTSTSDGMPFERTSDMSLESSTADGVGSRVELVPLEIIPDVTSVLEENSILMENENSIDVLGNLVTDIDDKNNEPEDLDLDNLFCEDSSSLELLAPEAMKQQRKNKLPRPAYCHTFPNVDDIWKKGDSKSIPKAFLQKLCQRLGWEAPKYSKLFEKENKYIYSVSILRKATGRGKSRQAGGLITLQLPDQDEACDSVEA